MLKTCRTLAIATAAVGLFVISTPANATIVIPGSAADPVADVFGSIPAATFGGSGIPNNAMMVSTSTFGSDTITIGIAATPRFSGTAVGNDGMGSYTVDYGEGDPGLSKWNFSFYANIDGGGSFEDYRFELAYDLDPASGTAIGDHGLWNLNDTVVFFGGGAALPATDTFETSQNAAFGFLNPPPSAFGITPPAATFDPNVVGEYTFELRVLSPLFGSTLVDKVSMSVAAVPEPTAGLFGSLIAGGLGLMVARRRREEG